MRDPRIDPEIAERLLDGEPADRPELAAVLAAASAGPAGGPAAGEEAAVQAFRAARSRPRPAPEPRRTTTIRVLGTKTMIAGALIAATGGVAVAATSSWHLPGTAETGRNPRSTVSSARPGIRSTSSEAPLHSPDTASQGPGRPVTPTPLPSGATPNTLTVSPSAGKASGRPGGAEQPKRTKPARPKRPKPGHTKEHEESAASDLSPGAAERTLTDAPGDVPDVP